MNILVHYRDEETSDRSIKNITIRRNIPRWSPEIMEHICGEQDLLK